MTRQLKEAVFYNLHNHQTPESNVNELTISSPAQNLTQPVDLQHSPDRIANRTDITSTTT